MACFWDCLREKMLPTDLQVVLGSGVPYSATALCQGFHRMVVVERNPVATSHTRWQNEHVPQQLAEELHMWITNYDCHGVSSGKYVSICDPHLMFLATHFQYVIRHRYLDSVIVYASAPPRHTMNIRSDRGHIS
jgi:hypothetical protein